MDPALGFAGVAQTHQRFSQDLTDLNVVRLNPERFLEAGNRLGKPLLADHTDPQLNQRRQSGNIGSNSAGAFICSVAYGANLLW